MDQKQRLDYLVEKFKEDSAEYSGLAVPDSEPEKRRILRSLMNIRMPHYLADEVLEVQDAFLKEDAREKGIVTLDQIPTVKDSCNSRDVLAEKISIWQGDITRLQVGAVVNAANSRMLGCFVPCHRCIDNAIHSAAGVELRAECSRQMNQKRIRYGQNYEEPTGQAMLTKGYNLPAEYVIHTVGPIVYYEVTDALREDLRNCYESVLNCCVEHQIRSVAFCCVSTGEFHFPNKEAAEIAVNTVKKFLEKHGDAFDRVIFNVFKDMDLEYYEKQFAE